LRQDPVEELCLFALHPEPDTPTEFHELDPCRSDFLSKPEDLLQLLRLVATEMSYALRPHVRDTDPTHREPPVSLRIPEALEQPFRRDLNTDSENT